MTAALKQDEFLERSLAKHGLRYDYSLVEYRHQYSNVLISCRTHGAFSQSPKNHMLGAGCPRCGRMKGGNRKKKSSAVLGEYFVERATDIYGERFDYSMVQYAGGKVPVAIYCRKHREWFMQSPQAHYRGAQSCRQCIRALASKPRKTTAEFVADVRRIHGDSYDYSGTIYVGAQSKITIVCREHGAFQQLATNHLSGDGCPQCGRGQLFHESHIPEDERNDPAVVYVLLIDVDGHKFSKVGYTSDFYHRRARLKHEGVFIDKSHTFETTKYAGLKTEREAHRWLAFWKSAPHRKFGGSRECYPAEFYNRLVQEMELRVCA